MPSRLTIVMHSILSLIVIAIGVYVLIEKKMIISGKYSGGLYELNYPANLLVAISAFLVAIFIMLVLVKRPYIKQICEGLFITALILFITGSLI